jgi:hypothetical protein
LKTLVRSLAAVLPVLLLAALVLWWLGRDIIVYATASTPLVAPVDSVCFKEVLAQRFGRPADQPVVRSRTEKRAAALWLHYGRAIFKQTYTDTGFATLSAARPVDSGMVAALLPPRTVLDSVGQQLGTEVLAVRDACGGRSRPNLPELTIGR